MGNDVPLLAQFYASPFGVLTGTMLKMEHSLLVAVHADNVDHGGGFRVSTHSG